MPFSSRVSEAVMDMPAGTNNQRLKTSPSAVVAAALVYPIHLRHFLGEDGYNYDHHVEKECPLRPWSPMDHYAYSLVCSR